MMNLTWKEVIAKHNMEKNTKRTVWRVLAYGIFKKNKLGYTPDQLIFILRKNFPNVSDMEWGLAAEYLMKEGFIYVTNRKNTKNTLSLTKKGRELVIKQYMA